MTGSAPGYRLSLAGTGGRWAVVLPWLGSLGLSAVAILDPGLPFSMRLPLWAALAILTVVTMVAWVRWLHGTGRSGYWALLGAVPVLGVFALPATLFWRRQTVDDGRYAPAPRYRLGLALICLSALFVLSRVAWAPYTIPSSSMSPTLEPGDYVLAWRNGQWARGDVVIFAHPVTGQDFTKRIIALPGESIAMEAGRPVLDGVPVPESPRAEIIARSSARPQMRCLGGMQQADQPCRLAQAVQTLPGGRAHRVLDVELGRLDQVPALVVPEGHVFVMGDHRDNSVDSRVPVSAGGVGPVPTDLIRGRIARVLFNFQGFDRFWVAVE